jgi:hypothetical protein
MSGHSSRLFLSSFLTTVAVVGLSPSKSLAGGNFYLGLGAQASVFIQNDTYSYRLADGIDIGREFLGNKLAMGLGIRIGYEHVFSNRLYLAAELYGTAMFDVSGRNSRLSNQPYLSGGIALKIGGTFNSDKTKLYLIAASEYMHASMNMPSIDTTLDIAKIDNLGLVFVGGGVGIKQSINRFMDIFLEFKTMFNVFTHGHYDSSPSNPPVTLSIVPTPSPVEEVSSFGTSWYSNTLSWWDAKINELFSDNHPVVLAMQSLLQHFGNGDNIVSSQTLSEMLSGGTFPGIPPSVIIWSADTYEWIAHATPPSPSSGGTGGGTTTDVTFVAEDGLFTNTGHIGSQIINLMLGVDFKF